MHARQSSIERKAKSGHARVPFDQNGVFDNVAVVQKNSNTLSCLSCPPNCDEPNEEFLTVQHDVVVEEDRDCLYFLLVAEFGYTVGCDMFPLARTLYTDRKKVGALEATPVDCGIMFGI
jgi:hypothetical protein